jgi:phosphatidylglycerophosphate synthase
VTDDAEAAAWLKTWTRAHAVAMPAACAVALAQRRAWPLVAIALLSNAALLARSRGRFTPRGSFGAANAVTAIRLAAVLGAGLAPLATPGWMLAAALAAVWVLDGIDGWIARRQGLASAFGDTFDKETDALLILVADVQLWQRGRFGLWILTTGLLRYAYVLALAIAPSPAGHVPRSRGARLAFLALLAGLMAGFARTGTAGTALAALGTAAVSASFAHSFFWSYRRRQD